MSDMLLMRNTGIWADAGEAACNDMFLTVDTPMELLGLGFTRFSGPIPDAMYPDDDDPKEAAKAAKTFAGQEQKFADTLFLTASLELHDRVLQTGLMRFDLSFDDGMPYKVYGRSDFLNNGRAIVFPGESYLLKLEREVPDADEGLFEGFDIWGRIDE